jgi:ribonuclease P protein component
MVRYALFTVGICRESARMDRNEKNISAKQSSSQTNSRISHPDEYHRGSRRSQETSRQRTQTFDRNRTAEASASLKAPNRSLPKSVRLLERREFLFLQQKGKKRHSQHFLVATAPTHSEHSRFGITTSRRFGNAVVRNRTKRLLREFFRIHQTLITPVCDIVVIPKAGAEQLTLVQITEELGKVFSIVQPEK